jgi:tyrosyl-DNA phosphodiesterase 1
MYCCYTPTRGCEVVPPHIKTFARLRPDANNDPRAAWVVITSHNLSSAAWGALQKNDSQLFIRHYEMGVLFLPSLCGNGRSFAIDDGSADGRVVAPLPYSWPPQRYSDGDVPWSWDVPQAQPDVFGNMVKT